MKPEQIITLEVDNDIWEEIERITDELEAQIGYIIDAPDPKGWTPDYKEGYLDGLRQALNIIK